MGKGTNDEKMWPKLIQKLRTLEKISIGKNEFGNVGPRKNKKLFE